MSEMVLYQYRGPYSNSSFPVSVKRDFCHSREGALQFSLLHLILCTALKLEQVSPNAPTQLCSGCMLSTQHLPYPAKLVETLSRFYCMNISSTDQDYYGMCSPSTQPSRERLERNLRSSPKEGLHKSYTCVLIACTYQKEVNELLVLWHR